MWVSDVEMLSGPQHLSVCLLTLLLITDSVHAKLIHIADGRVRPRAEKRAFVSKGQTFLLKLNMSQIAPWLGNSF